MSFEADDKVVLTMEDIPLYHQKSGELLQILDKIVCERCGVRAFFEVAYEEPKESKYREEDDMHAGSRKLRETVRLFPKRVTVNMWI